MSEKTESRFLKECARKPETLSKYSMVDIKHSIEQGVRHVLTLDYKYKEDHTLINRYLILGYVAAISAITSSAYSYTYPFEEPLTKLILIVGCGIYFLFVGLNALHTKYVKKDIIFVGNRSTGLEPEKIVVELQCDKYSDIVKLTFTIISKKHISYFLKKSVGEWYTTNGEFVPENFLADISSTIEGNSKKNK
ncbi:hypothetical protein HK103_004770 [Boothiomyces macroporosus]|uniref:Signal peptidase complex subunit 2 n=1 Tax=Boothiomyces macroporosus TaxID=261099 RepID=A0AAD5UM39_9FUNG|nr:hypothetical protein HK103_004770 [Boothiomyces macroporosus]